MNKWKKRSKGILVFLLILGFIGGMADHLQITAAAAQPVCICELLCTEASKAADCPVCGEDLSSCTGTLSAEQPDEKEDTDATDSPQISADSASDSQWESGKDLPADSKAPSEEESTPQPSTDLNADIEEADKDPTADSNADGEKEPDKDLPMDAEVTAVEELIKKLPSLDELKEFTQEEKTAVYEQVQKAFDAYESLKEDQKALLTGAEDLLKELLEYFTELAVPIPATEERIKNAWQAMTNAMEHWEAEVDLSGYQLTEADMALIWPDVAQDNPDLFYVFDYAYFTDKSTKLVTKCTFSYNTQYTQNSVAEYKAAIDKVFAEVIDNNMTDEQKALALHDYLVQHMVYDQSANDNPGFKKRNAYEALVNGIGVCQGYTLAYAALLEKAGIEVDYCKSASMNHIWNYVKLNGNWYHADLTFDDIAANNQTGETGYVKHEYFLLSDAAMAQAQLPHQWDTNPITCNDTTYDNSWHKTASIKESAIYPVNGSFYYLKGETVEGAPNTIYRGATLIKREINGAETTVGSFEIENLGISGGWPMYGMSFSRLSCSKGVLYFNVGNSVYAFRPSTDAKPVKFYQYEEQNNCIITGMLVNGNEMTLEIFNPTTAKMEEKIKLPISSVTGSEEQKNFAFSQKSKTVTYGNPDFTMIAKGAETGSSVSYKSSDSSIASVDPATGLIKIQKAGTVVITATASETPDYLEAKSTCTLTIAPKALTWDTSALEATDRLALIKDGKATLYGELKLAGILEKDKASLSFHCPGDKLTGIYETIAEGRQKVKLSWKSPDDTATLQGNGKENYTMPAALPEISGRISVLNESYQESANGTALKLQIENTISQVPDSFKDKEHLNTPGKIIKELKLKLREKFSDIAEANIAVYDVELLINVNGLGWQKVTKDNFPSEGLTITLPYPSGTGRNTHDYVVSHMFTADMNGFYAGDIEYPTVTKTEKGLTFKVYGLSPVSIGWKEISSSASQSTGSPSSVNKVTSPSTGDTSSVILYLLLAAAAFTGVLRLYTAARKSK